MAFKNGVIHADFLNVRSGTGTSFPVIFQLARGTQVTIVSTIDEWFEIDACLIEGYVSRAWVTFTAPQSGDGGHSAALAIVEPDALNIRSGASYEFGVMATVYKGTVLEILEEKTEWSRVKSKRLSGYILKDLVVEVYGGGAVPDALYKAVVNDPLVNVRSGAGVNYPITAVLPENTELKVKKIDHDWAEIETIVYEGYIRSEFIRKIDSEEPDSGSITTGTVNTNDLQLRTGPKTTYPSYALLKAGTGLKVLDVTSDWLRVKPIAASGFAARQYIRETGAPNSDIPSYDDDPLRPPASESIAIGSNFSDEQVKMATAWNKYGGLMKQICSHHHIDPGVGLAVLCVESGGKGYGPDGRLIVRFENHHFYRHWGANHESQFNKHFKFDRPNTWQGHHFRHSDAGNWQPVHTGQQQPEWAALQLAQQFDETAALKSISMGSPQIMGANFGTLGYSTVFQMFDDFQNDIRNQIIGLFLYIQGNDLTASLQNQDFIAFARGYNGQTRAEEYGRLLRTYVNKYNALSA
ncbi:MAG: SH3 domain-containing protein [Candidatus Zhuqueibacterota bacterium]